MVSYLLDTNFFIQAHRYSQPLDIATSFWEKVKDIANKDLVRSIDKVKNEIYENDDDLKAWCVRNLKASFYKNSSTAHHHYIEIVNWVNSKSDHYNTKAIVDFLDAKCADPWLLAYALDNGYTIVTHEISEPGRKNKVKIPDVGNAFDIRCIDPWKLFRELGINF